MSIESARAFLAKMKSDEEFRNRMVHAASKEQRRELAKAAGFRFTKEEVDRAMDELSDEELDQVAAGMAKKEMAGSGLHSAYDLFARTRIW
jgi:predicted ribosomally synthesized peptide with nif11-like leader